MPEERKETVGFTESEEIEWRQYFLDFRETVWPMFQAEGFTFVQAMMFWRQEIVISKLQEIINEFEEKGF